MRIQINKSFYYLALVVASLAFGLTAHAAGSYSLNSGPTGGVYRNGWDIYNLGIPSISITAGVGSSCGGTGTFNLPLNPGGGDGMGSHTLRYFYAPDDPKDDLWVSRDGILLGTMCNHDMAYSGSTVTVWEGNIKFDGWAPVAIIGSPSNNTNTNASTITISGSAYDTGDDNKAECMTVSRCSMVASVTVNGIAASLTGDKFSVSIPLSKGLNTIKATVTDNAGFASDSPSITVLRSDDVAALQQGSQGSKPSNSQPDSKTTATTAKVDANGTPVKENGGTEDKPPLIAQIPMPVKAATGVGAAGLGIASVLGYIPYKRIGLFMAKFFTK